MSRSGLGSCAFASVDDLLQHWLVHGEADVISAHSLSYESYYINKRSRYLLPQKSVQCLNEGWSAHSIGNRRTHSWKKIVGMLVQEIALHRLFISWFWGFDLPLVLKLWLLIKIGPMHCYVEVIRNWDAPVQCVVRPRTVTWASLNFTVCVCMCVCVTPRCNCGCYIDVCMALNDLFRTVYCVRTLLSTYYLGHPKPSCFTEDLDVRSCLR